VQEQKQKLLVRLNIMFIMQEVRYYFFVQNLILELLIFNIGLGFSTMSPIITMFAVIYFVVGYWRAKYSYVFVYPPNFNEGIKMTPLAINRIVIGMYIYQVTLLGVFTLKVIKYRQIKFKISSILHLVDLLQY
jgi:hypothetical protein